MTKEIHDAIELLNNQGIHAVLVFSPYANVTLSNKEDVDKEKLLHHHALFLDAQHKGRVSEMEHIMYNVNKILKEYN